MSREPHIHGCPSTQPNRGGCSRLAFWQECSAPPIDSNCYKGPKSVSKQCILPNFDEKGVEIRHFPNFCSNIGVKTIQTSHRPEKGGQNGGAYVVTFIDWIPSPGPGRLFDSRALSKTIPHDPCKATKLTIVTCSAIWHEAQQQCCRLTCNIWSRRYVLFAYLIMYTWLDKYVYMYTWLCIHARYLCIHAR